MSAVITAITVFVTSRKRTTANDNFKKYILVNKFPWRKESSYIKNLNTLKKKKANIRRNTKMDYLGGHKEKIGRSEQKYNFTSH